jgi:hypothetical protein
MGWYRGGDAVGFVVAVIARNPALFGGPLTPRQRHLQPVFGFKQAEQVGRQLPACP